MKQLIQEYKKSDKLLRDRIKQLNQLMKSPTLKTGEKDKLLARRALLYQESYGIRDRIAEMESIRKGVS